MWFSCYFVPLSSHLKTPMGASSFIPLTSSHGLGHTSVTLFAGPLLLIYHGLQAHQSLVYIVPLIPAAGEKKLYIKALEQRVAELESHLASLGQFGVGDDHLRLARLAGGKDPDVP